MNKFKIGDTVCCIGKSGHTPHILPNQDIAYGGFGWELGKKFVIREINENAMYDIRRAIYRENIDGYGVFDSHLMLCSKNCKECKNKLHCITN